MKENIHPCVDVQEIFFNLYDQHILFSLKFTKCLKSETVNQNGFTLAYFGIDHLEMLVLFQGIFILTSLLADRSMLNMIFSYDVNRISTISQAFDLL